MSWLLSTGLKNAILKQRGFARHAVAASTISCGDGDGSSSRDTINDSASGLGSFLVGDYITILGGTNDGVMARVLSVAAGTLEVAAGTLTAETAGTAIIIVACSGGCIQDIFKNATGYFYTGSRTTSADDAPVGTQLAQLTLNGGAFTSGSPTNGLNFGDGSSLTLGAEIDPATGANEIWKDSTPAATGAANSFWLCANTVDLTASTTAIRMVGRVGISGMEVNMAAGTTITANVPIQNVSIELSI